MAIAFVNAGTFTESASATSITPALPSSLVVGNVLIGVAISKASGTHTWPAGWTRSGNINQAGQTASFAYRRIDGTESAPNVTITNGPVATSAQLFQYSGANPFQFVMGNSGNSTSGTTHSSSANSTTTYSGAWLYVDACNANTAASTPSGYTEDSDTGGATSATRIAIGFQAATAGVGSTAISLTGGSAPWVQWSINIPDSSYPISWITGIATAPASVGPFKTTNAKIIENAGHTDPSSTINHANQASATLLASTFTAPSSVSVTKVTLPLGKINNPTDNYFVDIYATSAGVPTGSALASSDAVAGGGLGGGGPGVQTPADFTFSTPYALVASTVYALVLRRSGAVDITHYVDWGTNNTNTITGGSYTSNGTTWSAISTTNDFCFNVSGGDAYFFFGKDATTATTLQAFKATDPTASWASIATNTGFSTAVQCIAGYKNGDTIHLAVIDGATTSINLKYRTFNMTTDTFVTSETVHSAFNSQTVGNQDRMHCSIVYRSSDSQPVIAYNTTRVAVMGSSYARPGYARRTGVNTWSSNNIIEAVGGAFDYSWPEAVLGSSSRTHFLWDNETSPASYQRTLTSANALQTTVNISGIVFLNRAVSYDDGGTTRVISSDYGGRASYFDSADVPTITYNGGTGASNPTAIFVDGTTAWLIHQNTGDLDLYARSSTDDGASWSAPVKSLTASVAAAFTNISIDAQTSYLRGSNYVIAYVLNDNGQMKYHEYIVRSTSISGVASITEAGDTVAATGTIAGPLGVASITEANDTLAATGVLPGFGVLSKTEEGDTLVATSTIADASLHADFAVTEESDTVVATGTLPIVGTLSSTEAGDTVTSAGTIAGPLGVLAVTEAGDTVSATGKLALVGTLAVTEAGDTVAATGTLRIAGVLASTEAGDTVAATGTLPIVGTLSTTEAGDTLAATGTLPIVGTESSTENNDTLSATGTLAIVGTLAVTQEDDTLVATGATAAAIVGTLAVTEADDTLAATGALPIVGTLAVTEAGDTTTSAGALPIVGTDASTEGNDTLAATGTLAIVGTLASTEEGDTLAATGALAASGTGVLAVTEDSDTVAATGTLPIVGTLAVTEAGDTTASAATLPIVGTESSTENNDTLAATGTLRIAGTLAKTEDGDTVASTGTLRIAGTLGSTEAGDTVTSTGTLAGPLGVATITEASDTLVATGTLAVVGTLAKTEEDDTLVATSIAGSQPTALGVLASTENDDTLVATGATIVPLFVSGGYATMEKPDPWSVYLQRLRWLLKGKSKEIQALVERYVREAFHGTAKYANSPTNMAAMELLRVLESEPDGSAPQRAALEALIKAHNFTKAYWDAFTNVLKDYGRVTK